MNLYKNFEDIPRCSDAATGSQSACYIAVAMGKFGSARIANARFPLVEFGPRNIQHLLLGFRRTVCETLKLFTIQIRGQANRNYDTISVLTLKRDGIISSVVKTSLPYSEEKGECGRKSTER